MGFGAELMQLLDGIPAPLAVFILAASPVGEVRMSIPVAILGFGMGWAEAFTWSLLGNLMVVPIATWFYPALDRLIHRSKRLGGWVDRWFERVRRKQGENVERNREFAVFGFIATPVPGTGAWSGVLVAYLFDVPLRQAARFYYAGIVVACFLTAFAVEAGLWGFNQL